jgi:hypothetical protein
VLVSGDRDDVTRFDVMMAPLAAAAVVPIPPRPADIRDLVHRMTKPPATAPQQKAQSRSDKMSSTQLERWYSRMKNGTAFERLGLPEGADTLAVQQRFSEATRRFDPARVTLGSADDRARLKQIHLWVRQAYQVLSAPKLRRVAPAQAPAAPEASAPTRTEDHDWSDARRTQSEDWESLVNDARFRAVQEDSVGAILLIECALEMHPADTLRYTLSMSRGYGARKRGADALARRYFELAVTLASDGHSQAATKMQEEMGGSIEAQKTGIASFLRRIVG